MFLFHKNKLICVVVIKYVLNGVSHDGRDELADYVIYDHKTI